MRHSLDEFLALPQDQQMEYWSHLDYIATECHETWCAISVEANTDTSIGSGRIPSYPSCNCSARDL